jgi:hypothetical protein
MLDDNPGETGASLTLGKVYGVEGLKTGGGSGGGDGGGPGTNCCCVCAWTSDAPMKVIHPATKHLERATGIVVSLRRLRSNSFRVVGAGKLTPGSSWSVAQFVEGRFAPARRDGRAGTASAAARCGHAARSGPSARCRSAARCGHATRSVTARVRAGGYVAEGRGHFLVAENARRWRLGRCRLTTLTTRLLLSRRSNLRCRWRCRQEQSSNQREILNICQSV